MRSNQPMLAVLALSALAACSTDSIPTEAVRKAPVTANAEVSAGESGDLVSLGRAANARLAAAGAAYRLEYAETLGGNAEGALVLFSDRGNKQLEADWIPGDEGRGGVNYISYIVDQTDVAIDGLTTAQVTGAIDRAMTTWDNVKCSTIPIARVDPIDGVNLGVATGSPYVLADITHAGWLPAGILPTQVIGVTLTAVWVDEDGNPTDLDHNGKEDVAFREIYYNDLYRWNVNGAANAVDVESVALHESGHGLSQAHFGMAFLKKNGDLQFAPRAVMNAAYAGVQRTLLGTDNGGHCSIWANWPNR